MNVLTEEAIARFRETLANKDGSKIRAGMMTGGGDAPGLNAVIEGVTKTCLGYGWEVLGFLDGWAGVLQKSFIPMTAKTVKGIRTKGGTILFTSRTPIFPKKAGQADLSDEAVAALNDLGISVLFVVGGEDTQGEGWKLYIHKGILVIGIPKTIDNDVNETDFTFGYNTAVSIAGNLIKKLHTTAQSHHRVMVVEVMGRHAGWLGLESAIAGEAHGVWIPEMNDWVDVLDMFIKIVRKRYADEDPAEHYAVFAVSEGAADEDMIKRLTKLYGKAKEVMESGGMSESEIAELVPSDLFDAFGHINLSKLGVAKQVARAIKKAVGSDLKKSLGVPFECREVVLSHLQRAGSPVAFDANLCLRLGIQAAQMAHECHFGQMASLKGNEMTGVSLEAAMGTLKIVPEYRWRQAVDLMQFEIEN